MVLLYLEAMGLAQSAAGSQQLARAHSRIFIRNQTTLKTLSNRILPFSRAAAGVRTTTTATATTSADVFVFTLRRATSSLARV